MISVKTNDIKTDFKRISKLLLNGEKVLISRPHNKNIVMMSEEEFNQIDKIRRNAEYLAMLDKSQEQIKNGQYEKFTLDGLKNFLEIEED